MATGHQHADAIMMSIHIVEKWERKRSKPVHLLWKEAELKTRSTVRSKPSGTKVTSGLLLRIMSGPVVLQWLGVTLTSTAHVATKGHMDAWGLGCHLWPCQCSRVVLLGP